MNIEFNKNDGALYVALDGRLDTTTAPELEKFLSENCVDVKELTLNCENLLYISSA